MPIDNGLSRVETTDKKWAVKRSPINVLSGLLSMLKERFNATQSPNFAYDEDPTKATLFLDVYYSKTTSRNNEAPRITVGRGSYVSQRFAIGDQDPQTQERITKGLVHSTRGASMDIYMACIAETAMEAERLGELAWSFIEMSRTTICQQLGLRDISSVVLQPVRPVEKDQEKFLTRVEFRVEMENRWATIDASLPIEKVRVSAQTNGSGASALFEVPET